jgi:hypothetical protein
MQAGHKLLLEFGDWFALRYEKSIDGSSMAGDRWSYRVAVELAVIPL